MLPTKLNRMSAPNRLEGFSPGVSLAEYAILIGLIAIVGMAGLKLLGSSTSGVLQGTAQPLAQGGTLNLLAPVPNAGSAKSMPGNQNPVVVMKGGGYYALIPDPTTGQPVLKLVDGSQGVGTNVSSIDGGRMNVLGSMMLAKKLDQLASEEADPTLKAYYEKMARLSYYLGGAEGELDDVPGLDQDVMVYNNGDALRDIYQYSKALQSLLQNPPSNMDSEAMAAVLPLGANVYNIAKNYMNSLSQFITPGGKVTAFANAISNASGSGEPGSAMQESNLIATGTGLHPSDYTRLVDYGRIKTMAKQLLSDKQVDSVPVESTLSSAVSVDEQAQATSP